MKRMAQKIEAKHGDRLDVESFPGIGPGTKAFDEHVSMWAMAGAETVHLQFTPDQARALRDALTKMLEGKS